MFGGKAVKTYLLDREAVARVSVSKNVQSSLCSIKLKKHQQRSCFVASFQSYREKLKYSRAYLTMFAVFCFVLLYGSLIFLKEFAYPALAVGSPWMELGFKMNLPLEASEMKGNYVLSRDSRSFQVWCGERMWMRWSSFGGSF